VNDDVLTLISTVNTQDEYAVFHEEKVERDVFCQVYSISRSEFYGSGRSGLNPEYEFRVFAGDYEGEKLCKFHNQEYAIYRTYIVPGEDYIELYVERKGGTNG